MSPGAAGLAPRVAFGALADNDRGKRSAIDAGIARILECGWFVSPEP
jgi:hypothetical protein